MWLLLIAFLFAHNLKTGGAAGNKECPLPNCPAGVDQSDSPASCWSPPLYAATGALTEKCVSFKSSSWTLSGALTLPVHKSIKKPPVIVIIGGSGPTDMDSTAGPNKPLKDIAYGLSSAGIAVLRFNKRSAQYPGTNSFPNGTYELMTIEEEYTHDTVAALKFVAAHPHIDPTRIFLAGHSEGGEVAPGISSFGGFKGLRGLILLAAPPVSLPSLLTWQYYYLTNYNPVVADLMSECVAKILSPTLLPTDLVQCNAALKWPAIYGNYYISERKYDPPTSIVNNKLGSLPVLVLQGEADYNVPFRIPPNIDLHGLSVPTFSSTWAKLFAKSRRVTTKAFPCLNHLFMKSNCTGFATSQQTFVKSSVDGIVIKTLASWVLAQ